MCWLCAERAEQIWSEREGGGRDSRGEGKGKGKQEAKMRSYLEKDAVGNWLPTVSNVKSHHPINTVTVPQKLA